MRRRNTAKGVGRQFGESERTVPRVAIGLWSNGLRQSRGWMNQAFRAPNQPERFFPAARPIFDSKLQAKREIPAPRWYFLTLFQ
jgi:hypothetical protein